jgi:3,4-dihydroxy 2-butanone 4-phosphate synthase/GTP cyclohydrolase II
MTGSGGVSSERAFATIPEALEELRCGKMVVICDDEDRENEGDLAIAAEFVTAEVINFMVKEGRGLVCLAMTSERCDSLGLTPMAGKNESRFETAFTVSIEAREGVTTGISASDRAHTVQTATRADATPDDLVSPGHVFPLTAKPGGVLERGGQTEAAVDLARLAGLAPAGVICEIMNDDGTMARVPDLIGYSERHGLLMITVADLIAYRRSMESDAGQKADRALTKVIDNPPNLRVSGRAVERVVETGLPTTFGDFRVFGYRSLSDDSHHMALVKGGVEGVDDVLVRVHSQCVTGDVFHSLRCDCGEQLGAAMSMIEAEGRGVLLYLAQEGRGIGLLNKLRAYELQDTGFDTVDANLELGLPVDLRDYGVGAAILADLGLHSIRLLTNNPKKIVGLAGCGLIVSEQLPIPITPNSHNARYLSTKTTRLGHLPQAVAV